MEHERVRRRAYEIWEREGRPGGRHDDHWGRAAEEIAAEDGGPSQDPAGGAAPGPDSGLRTPPSAVERGLREAADALRSAGAEEPGVCIPTKSATDSNRKPATVPGSSPLSVHKRGVQQGRSTYKEHRSCSEVCP